MLKGVDTLLDGVLKEYHSFFNAGLGAGVPLKFLAKSGSAIQKNKGVLNPLGSRVALKRVAFLFGTSKLKSAEGVPIIFLLLSGRRSGTQYFADLFGRVPLLDLSKKIAKN